MFFRKIKLLVIFFFFFTKLINDQTKATFISFLLAWQKFHYFTIKINIHIAAAPRVSAVAIHVRDFKSKIFSHERFDFAVAYVSKKIELITLSHLQWLCVACILFVKGMNNHYVTYMQKMFIGNEGHVYLNFYERSFANKVVLIHIVLVWAEVAGNSIFFFFISTTISKSEYPFRWQYDGIWIWCRRKALFHAVINHTRWY